MNVDTGAIGLVPGGTLHDEVLAEMLEHQGISCEYVDEKNIERKYPIVLATRAGTSSLALARQASASGDGVIAVDGVIDLEKALRCFSGLDGRREDRYELQVNELELNLMAAIKSSLSKSGFELIRKNFWPGNAPACCVISSDIDWLTYSPFHAAVVKGSKSPSRIAALLLGSVSGKDFGLNFDSMMDVLVKHDCKSTVFLRTSYEDGKERLAEAIDLLKKSGFEIGLHGSNRAHLSIESLKSQMEIIESRTGIRPRGIRHHILKMDNPLTWEIESKAGLEYDATFSYNRYFGFRGEICFPYHPFGSSRLPLLELPTSFMDWTALKRGFRGTSAKEVLELIMERVEHYRGLLMVNFHNTYLNRDTFPDVIGLYEDLVEQVSRKGYWVATASACSDWWKRRASFRPTVNVKEKHGVEDDITLETIQDVNMPSSVGA